MSRDLIELLHLSDLHFGPFSRFAKEDPPTLGRSFAKALLQERERLSLPEGLDLAIVTGDLAEAGKPREFDMAAGFLGAVAEVLKVEPRRFVFVPGNHDVSWALCKKIESDRDEEEFDESEFRRRLDAVKLQRYEEFLTRFYGGPPEDVPQPLPRGACLYRFPDLRLTVAALNSCEAESHRRQDHKGLVSQEQAQAVMDAWRSAELSSWIKVVAVHHNPVVTVPANIADWRGWLKKAGLVDDELLARYESDVVGFEGKEFLEAIVKDACAQLVLHGHHHAKDEHSWHWRKRGRAHVLSAGSLTLEPGHLPQDEPASFRFISLDLKEREIRAQSLVYEGRARAEGEVKKGTFVPDPAEPGGYAQSLDLPTGFALNQAEDRTPTGSSEPSREFLGTYRRRLGSLFARWDLASAGVTQAGGAGRPIEATLDHMYLPLRLAPGFDIYSTDQGGLISPEDLLLRDLPLAIRGSAGAGKTTWMRWTFRRLLETEEAVPLTIVLRDLARRWRDPNCHGAARSLDAFLAEWLAQQVGADLKECQAELRNVLAAETGPRPILLVDGWDEMGPLGEELRSKLLGLMAEHPRLLVVATSRPYGEGRPTYSEGFETLDIQPFSDEEIAGLAGRFFQRCYGEEPVKAESEAKRLVETLGQAPEAKVLARTALLLTMMLLISRSRPLPDKRHLLYEVCLENLLNAIPKRRADQGVLSLSDQWRPEDSEERLRVVAALAFRLQEEGYRQRNRSSIVQTWDAMAARLPESWSVVQRHGFLAWLAGPAGLLTDRADGTLVFTHLSFQEYLAAWYLNATVEGREDRIAAFCAYQTNWAWWETLRLWAALIERQSPDRLEPVLEKLSGGSYNGISLAGAMLADGLGEEARFQAWSLRLQEILLHGIWTFDMETCARAWAGSQQMERRDALASKLRAIAIDLKLFGWARCEKFLASLGSHAPLPPEGSLSRTILDSVEGRDPTARSVASARFLCGGFAIWPFEPLEAGLLQVWPSQRRMAGIRLQLAVAFGARPRDLQRLARHLLPAFRPGPEEEQYARCLAPRFARELAHYVALDFARGYACDIMRYFARYFVRYFGRDAGSDFVRNFGHDLARYLSRDLKSDLSRDLALKYGPYMIFDFARFFGRHISRDMACGWARYFGLDEAAPWVYEFFVLDVASMGRGTIRSALAAQSGKSQGPEVTTLAMACRHAFRYKDSAETLLESPESLHPLWPALARHIARLSTPEDKALLMDLAQHPEKCEPPLSWGLQYVVRGDVLLENGSVITLDQLADEVGLPHLPYLEDMPEELEVDWEVED